MGNDDGKDMLLVRNQSRNVSVVQNQSDFRKISRADVGDKRYKRGSIDNLNENVERVKKKKGINGHRDETNKKISKQKLKLKLKRKSAPKGKIKNKDENEEIPPIGSPKLNHAISEPNIKRKNYSLQVTEPTKKRNSNIKYRSNSPQPPMCSINKKIRSKSTGNVNGNNHNNNKHQIRYNLK